MQNSTEIIEALWGAATLAKKVSHYTRLRVGQLKARHKRHKKRLMYMLDVATRMSELGVNIKDEAYQARLRFERALASTAFKEYNLKRTLSPEEQKETQLAYRRTAV